MSRLVWILFASGLLVNYATTAHERVQSHDHNNDDGDDAYDEEDDHSGIQPEQKRKSESENNDEQDDDEIISRELGCRILVFGSRLFLLSRRERENQVLSPLALHSSLSAASLGLKLRKKSFKELSRALGFDSFGSELEMLGHKQYKRLLDSFHSSKSSRVAARCSKSNKPKDRESSSPNCKKKRMTPITVSEPEAGNVSVPKTQPANPSPAILAPELMRLKLSNLLIIDTSINTKDNRTRHFNRSFEKWVKSYYEMEPELAKPGLGCRRKLEKMWGHSIDGPDMQSMNSGNTDGLFILSSLDIPTLAWCQKGAWKQSWSSEGKNRSQESSNSLGQFYEYNNLGSQATGPVLKATGLDNTRVIEFGLTASKKVYSTPLSCSRRVKSQLNPSLESRLGSQEFRLIQVPLESGIRLIIAETLTRNDQKALTKLEDSLLSESSRGRAPILELLNTLDKSPSIKLNEFQMPSVHIVNKQYNFVKSLLANNNNGDNNHLNFNLTSLTSAGPFSEILPGAKLKLVAGQHWAQFTLDLRGFRTRGHPVDTMKVTRQNADAQDGDDDEQEEDEDDRNSSAGDMSILSCKKLEIERPFMYLLMRDNIPLYLGHFMQVAREHFEGQRTTITTKEPARC